MCVALAPIYPVCLYLCALDALTAGPCTLRNATVCCAFRRIFSPADSKSASTHPREEFVGPVQKSPISRHALTPSQEPKLLAPRPGVPAYTQHAFASQLFWPRNNMLEATASHRFPLLQRTNDLHVKEAQVPPFAFLFGSRSLVAQTSRVLVSTFYRRVAKTPRGAPDRSGPRLL